MTKLSTRVILLIQNHELMKLDACAFLNMEECKYTYNVFEKILVHMAERNKVKWQELWNAKPSNPELYAELCVAVLLIDRYLNDLFDYSERYRNMLIGYRFVPMLEDYYQVIAKM